VSVLLRRFGRNRSTNRGTSQWTLGLRRFKKNKAGLLGVGILFSLVLIAAFHDIIAPYPARPHVDALKPLYDGEAGQEPSFKHPFGTTVMGTDVYSEVIHGTVFTLYVAIMVLTISSAIGVLVGITAGYLGKYVDDVLMRGTEIIMVFPMLLILMTIARIYQLTITVQSWNVFGLNIPVGLTIIAFIMSIFMWTSIARIIRGEVLRIKEQEYILATRSLGASSRWIMFHHIFPNILPQIIVLSTNIMANAVLFEAGLSFLGFGDPNTVTWGRMLQESFNDISTVWWAEIFPGLILFLTILAFNFIGDALADALNPRLRE
jgi:ABC-type dipeptide/oligopeptide/nickel transport system permease subunit